MKQKAENIIALLSGAMAFVMFFMFFEEASATNNGPERLAQAQEQGQQQGQEQSSISAAAANSESVATASNDGNSLSVGGDSVENNSSTVVLVPNNNTESCLRVFGIAFGKNGESGALGIPWRSARCDYEQAADDAFAAGERDLGWFWKCQNKNLYKRFQDKGESVDSAIDDCHVRMLATTSTNDVIRKLEERLEASENMIEFQKRHQEVCDESLERCERKAYGNK